MSARARIRRRWRAFIRPGGGRAFSSQSLLQLCQQTLPTRHSPRVRPSAGHHAERNRFQISRLNTLAVFASPLLLAPAGKEWAGTHRSWLTSSSPCEALHTQHSQRSAPPSTSRLRTGRPALCERGGVEIEPQAAHEITYMLQAAAATTSSQRPARAAAWQHARGRMGSREGAGSRTLRLRQPGRCGPSWAGRRCRTCTLSGRCCSFPQRSTFFNNALRPNCSRACLWTTIAVLQ